MRRAGLLLGLWLTLASPVWAQSDAATAARSAVDQLDRAAAALNAAREAPDRVAALTRTVAAYEAGLAALREGIRDVAAREQGLRDSLAADNQKLSRLLGVLQILQSAPETTLLLHPSGPLDTLHAGMLLSDMTPGLRRELDKLKLQMAEVAALRELQERAAKKLTEGLDGVRAARTALGRAVDERGALPRRLVDDPDALSALAESADTLEGFATALREADAKKGPRPAPRAFPAARGTLPMPVDGTVIRASGEADAAGITRPGLLIATEPSALVTAPWQATIRYQGPLLDYKNVMVLEPSRGFLLVLAGLDTVYGQVGDVMPQGTPVGLMGGSKEADTDLTATQSQSGGQQQTETLYMELRQGDDPVDPATWFATGRE
ncbi:MAG: peptidoglycan DD-metalloendopeptidase family protein [Rhodobacteraceae bacterium]|nr:peptidoglycan DD-metalloendopeptidase family protein [Paracoccaceae bacterium]